MSFMSSFKRVVMLSMMLSCHVVILLSFNSCCQLCCHVMLPFMSFKHVIMLPCYVVMSCCKLCCHVMSCHVMLLLMLSLNHHILFIMSHWLSYSSYKTYSYCCHIIILMILRCWYKYHIIMCKSVYAWVYVCMYVCVRMCVFACVCVSVDVYACMCVWTCVWIYKCAYECPMCTGVWARACVCVPHVYLRVCMCICIYLCISNRLHFNILLCQLFTSTSCHFLRTVTSSHR